MSVLFFFLVILKQTGNLEGPFHQFNEFKYEYFYKELPPNSFLFAGKYIFKGT